MKANYKTMILNFVIVVVSLILSSVTAEGAITKFQANPSSGSAPLLVTFTFQSADSCNDGMNEFFIIFGDGAVQEFVPGVGQFADAQTSHNYVNPGTYTAIAELRCVGSSTIVANAIQTIIVSPPCSGPPAVNITGIEPQNTVEVGTILVIFANASRIIGCTQLDTNWQVTLAPNGSIALPTPTSGFSTNFTPDLAGQYSIKFSATNEFGSTSDTVTVIATEPLPGLESDLSIYGSGAIYAEPFSAPTLRFEVSGTSSELAAFNVQISIPGSLQLSGVPENCTLFSIPNFGPNSESLGRQSPSSTLLECRGIASESLSASFLIPVNILALGELFVSASLSPGAGVLDTDLTNNNAAISLVVQEVLEADISVELSQLTPSIVRSGDPIELLMSVRNNGSTTTGIRWEVVAPEGLRFIEAPISLHTNGNISNSINVDSICLTESVFSCALTNVETGEGFDAILQLDADAFRRFFISARAWVEAESEVLGIEDPDASNNFRSSSVTVVEDSAEFEVDLSIDVNALGDLTVDSPVSVEFDIANAGPAPSNFSVLIGIVNPDQALVYRSGGSFTIMTGSLRTCCLQVGSFSLPPIDAFTGASAADFYMYGNIGTFTQIETDFNNNVVSKTASISASAQVTVAHVAAHPSYSSSYFVAGLLPNFSNSNMSVAISRLSEWIYDPTASDLQYVMALQQSEFPSADLSISVINNNENSAPNGEVTTTFSIENRSEVPISDVLVAINVSGPVEAASASGTDWECEQIETITINAETSMLSETQNSITIQCNNSMFSANESSMLHLNTMAATPDGDSRIGIMSLVIGETTDLDLVNNSAEAFIDVNTTNSDLEIVQAFNVSAPSVGESFSSIIEVNNLGPSDASGVRVDLIVEPTDAYSTAISADWICTARPPSSLDDMGELSQDSDQKNLVCINDKIESGGSSTILLELISTETAIVVTTSVSSSILDPNESNNSSIGIVGPTPDVADLDLTSVATPDLVFTGTLFTYELEITNHGPESAQGLAVGAIFPAGFVPVSTSSEDDWSCVETELADGFVDLLCSLENLGNSLTTSLILEVEPQSNFEDLTINFFVVSETLDPDTTNNGRQAVLDVL